jgi:hypothetical protein
MMDFVQTYGKELVALLVPFISWALTRFFRARARLVQASPHNFTFMLEEPLKDGDGNILAPKQFVHTSSLLVRNAGRDTATNVELVFNWKPPFINVWPARHRTDFEEPDGRYVLKFDSLAPNEVLGCELLSINQDLPILVTARSDQCVAQNVEMMPMVVMKPWQIRAGVFRIRIRLEQFNRLLVFDQDMPPIEAAISFQLLHQDRLAHAEGQDGILQKVV